MLYEDISEKIIRSAIEVHKNLGPGLLESAYEECLCHELNMKNLMFERQKPIPIEYKGIKLDCGYRIDIIVENKIILEIKAVEKILPVHEAQLMTYLKLTHMRVGLIINFNVKYLKEGLKRIII
jgi:GxxExxY protein